MPDDDQPTIPMAMPQGSRASAPGIWQAPSVEQMQAVLPQYEVLEILGRGGMGAVYKARQKSLKRLVAIKILPLEAADDELKFAERFQNEAQTMAQMNHPAIVSVYDFGETTDGLLYFVMEFVDGTDVQQMLQASGRLTGEHALSITAHVCDALDYAHKRGVIHRDIKPANILIDQEGHIKVADFGLAKMHDPSITSGLTRSNVAMGTPDYVAPEVLSRGLMVDHRADLYAVGVMLYQMLTGEVPRGMFKLPSAKGIGTDPRFDAIICKAMETDREERYQSAGDVRQALEMIRTTTLEKKVVSALAESGDARFRLKSKLLYAAVAIVLVVATFFILGGKPKPSASPATTAPSLPSIAQGKTIDLLALVDVKRDALAGEWSREGGDLLVKATKPGADGTSRLQLPYQPPEEYDFEIEFTPESGTNALYQVLSAYEHSFAWVLDANLAAGHKAGFDRIDRKLISGRTDGTTMRPQFLTNGQRHRSTVEVRKTGVRGLLDGELLVSYGKSQNAYQALDSSPNEALRDALHLGLATYDRSVRFHKLTVREISGAGKVEARSSVPASPAASSSPPKITTWRDGTEEAREKAKAMPDLVVDEQGIRRAGAGPSVRLLLTPQGPRDQAILVHYTGEAQVDLRINASGFFYVLAQTKRTIFQSQPTGTNVPVILAPTKLHPADFDTGSPHELLVTIEGTRLRAWLDGRFVSEAKADTFTEGATALMFMPKTVVHKVELADLTADPTAAPSITNWQDVTESVREKARTLPGLVVDADGVRRPDGAPNATTALSGVESGDRAVRVRYVGQVQVSLWFKGGTGSAYVLAQRNQTMFKRASDTGVPESLRPTVPHPSGFDANQPHEFLLTVQGSMLRVWLDGRFVGEVQDDAFKETSTALAFMVSSTVQKVEIAKIAGTGRLDASPSPAQTFNGHRYQFVPGSFNWQEAKVEAQKRGGHLAVITSAEENEWAWVTFSGQLSAMPKEDRWMRGWWLGASQSSAEKAWEWLTAEAMSYTQWGKSEPRAAILPPRSLWMADDASPEHGSKWSAQKMTWKGGFLVEWDSAAP